MINLVRSHHNPCVSSVRPLRDASVVVAGGVLLHGSVGRQGQTMAGNIKNSVKGYLVNKLGLVHLLSVSRSQGSFPSVVDRSLVAVVGAAANEEQTSTANCSIRQNGIL